MSVEIDDIKFIPKDEVPERRRRTDWDTIFTSIPKGQAAVFSEKQIMPSAVRQALQRRQKRGLFRNIDVVISGKKGTRTVYVVNSDE